MRVVTVSGRAQHGKDTVANMIKEELESKYGYTVLITHYADLLKYVCMTFFDWDGRKDTDGRTLLQYVGTDIVRKRNPDFWVDFIISILSMFGGRWDRVLIPDVRFPNEVFKLRKAGFITTHIEVVRPNFSSPLSDIQMAHPSEESMECVAPDIRLINDGTLDDLRSKIINSIIKEII